MDIQSYQTTDIAISKEKIGNSIVGSVKIHPPVAIQVSGNNTPRFGARLCDTRFFADVR